MPTANTINADSAGLVRYDGSSTFDAVTVTQHDLLIGGTSNGITSVSPSATSGVPVISQGAAADPTFGTVVVAGGGTGRATLTNHGVLVGAGTSAITQLSAGTANTVLTSGGASADPLYTTNFKITSDTMTNTSQPGFGSALGSTASSVTGDGTNFTIICNSAAPNQGANYNTGTGTFTAPVTGTYLFSCYITVNGMTSSHTQGSFSLAINGTRNTAQEFNPFAIKDANGNACCSFTTIVSLTATNTVTMLIQVSGGTKAVSVQGQSTGNFTGFNGWLLG